jgi:hypothetical protein
MEAHREGKLRSRQLLRRDVGHGTAFSVEWKKVVLFWKKEPKNFCVAIAVLSGNVAQGRKSFLVLFFKKELLASFYWQLKHSS